MLRSVRGVLGVAAVFAMTFSAIMRGAGAAPAAKAAPAVEWRDAGGGVVRMADTKGKVVLVDFWASWCPPCKESFPALEVLQRDYRARDVRVIAVNVDERQKDADAFLAAHPHQLLVVFDPHGESPKAFKVRGMPSSFVIDRAGNIRYTHQGYTQAVDAAYRREIDTLIAETAR
jgi:thiol-disulfide isomerase/thioredoxin